MAMVRSPAASGLRARVCQERRHCPAPGEARDCGGASFRLESLITVVQLQAKTANTTDALAANDSIPTNVPNGQVRATKLLQRIPEQLQQVLMSFVPHGRPLRAFSRFSGPWALRWVRTRGA